MSFEQDHAQKRLKMSALSRLCTGILTVAFLFSALSACDYMPFGFVSVSDIIQNPTKYDGQKIKLKGRVSNVTKIPFMEIKLYALSDHGQQIMVVAKDTVPAANSEIAVIGIVENIAIVGDQSVGLHLREIKRLDHVFY